jgi:hypothetical protein
LASASALAIHHPKVVLRDPITLSAFDFVFSNSSLSAAIKGRHNPIAPHL